MQPKAASSASTNADASSGCSSPPPDAGSPLVRPRCPVSRRTALGQTALVPEPGKRVQAGLDCVIAVERDAADDQRVRQPGVVVRQPLLEPAPALDGVRLERVLELRHAALEQRSPRGVEPVRVEPRESEDGVRGRAVRQLALQRVDERGKQTSRRPDCGRHPGRREHVTERPDRAADMIADVWFVEPAPVVAHEVPHAGAVGCVVEKCQRAVQHRDPDSVARALFELERDDCEPRNVVDAIAALPIRYAAVGVLDDAAVVDERQQMVGPRVGELQLDARRWVSDEARRWSPRARPQRSSRQRKARPESSRCGRPRCGPRRARPDAR